MALVEAFLEQAPRVQFRLVEAFTGQIRGWLEEGKIDLGIVNDLGPMRNLLSRPIASEELYLVGPWGRFGAQDIGNVAAGELSSLPMILPGPQHGLRQVIDHALARQGVSVNIRVEIDAMMHVPALIAGGHGYSILPLSALSEALAKKQVALARIADGVMRRTLCLARNSGRVVTHASVRGEAPTMRVLGVNLRGPLYVAVEAARRLGAGGRIINVSSSLAEYPMAGSGIYSATKVAIQSFTESWARELRITLQAHRSRRRDRRSRGLSRITAGELGVGGAHSRQWCGEHLIVIASPAKRRCAGRFQWPGARGDTNAPGPISRRDRDCLRQSR